MLRSLVGSEMCIRDSYILFHIIVQMSFLEDVEKYFGVKCLYSALDVPKDAKDKQIKRAYHKFSLLCHPDRSTEDNKELNTVKFQTLSRIHSILSNKDKRAIYDETGDIPDERDITTQNKDWEAYWRILFKKVTKSDIEKFESEYRHSSKENEDLKKCYIEFEGDMEEILNNMLCSTADDEDRFTKTINDWLSSGEVPEFDAFMNENQVKKKKRKKKVYLQKKIYIYIILSLIHI